MKPGLLIWTKTLKRYLPKQLFDHTDVIFVDGDANLLPWYRRAERLLLLFRMIDRTKKLVFGAACGMTMLVFLASCSHDVRRVVNGDGKGGSLEDAQKLPREDLRQMTRDEVILDNTSGDIYQYDHQRHEFFPIGNVGFHYHKAAQGSAIARSSILKPFTYVPKIVDDPYPAFLSTLHEAKCRVLKQCGRHWLVQGLGLQEFLVSQYNAWDVHPLNATQSSSRLFVLAESGRGPQIVTWKGNFVGVMFHVDPKYAQTVTVLKNYVGNILYRFEHESERVDQPLALTNHLVRQTSTNQILLDRERRLIAQAQQEVYPPLSVDSRPMSGTTRPISAVRPYSAVRPLSGATSTARPQTAKTRLSTGRPTTASSAIGLVVTEQSVTAGSRPVSAVSAGKHSGFAFSKRHHDPLIVGNNATTEAPITLTTARPRTPYIPTSPMPLYDSPKSDRLGSPKTMVISGDFDKEPSVSRLRTFYGISNTVQVSPRPEPKPADIPADQQNSEKTSHNTYEYRSSTGSEKPGEGVWKQQSEIRALLHPGYPISSMPRSKTRSESAFGKKVVKLSVKRVSYTSIHKPEPVDPFPKTRTTNYPNLGLTVANDGAQYQDPEVKKRAEARESKAKWVSNRDFEVAFSRKAPAAIPNYVRLTPSEPPGLHQFRTEDKEKWLAGQFKVPSY